MSGVRLGKVLRNFGICCYAVFQVEAIYSAVGCGNDREQEVVGTITKLEYRPISGSLKGFNSFTYRGIWSYGWDYKSGDTVLHNGNFWIASSDNSDVTPSFQGGSWSSIGATKYEVSQADIRYDNVYKSDQVYTPAGSACNDIHRQMEVHSSYSRTDTYNNGAINSQCSGQGNGVQKRWLDYSDNFTYSFTYVSCDQAAVTRVGNTSAPLSSTDYICNGYGDICLNDEIFFTTLSSYEGVFNTTATRRTERESDGTFNPRTLSGPGYCSGTTLTHTAVNGTRSERVFALSGAKSGVSAALDSGSTNVWTSGWSADAWLGEWVDYGDFTFNGREVRYQVKFDCLSDAADLEFTYRVWPVGGDEVIDGKDEKETKSAGSLEVVEEKDGGKELRGTIEPKDGFHKRLVKVAIAGSCGGHDDYFGGPFHFALGSVQWKVSLGKGVGGQSLGNLRVEESQMSAETATPRSLKYDGGINSEVQILKDNLDRIKQVKTPQGLVDVVVSNEYSYELRFYDVADVEEETEILGEQGGPPENQMEVSTGFYRVSGTPISVWKIENPDTGTAFNKLKITHTIGDGEGEGQYTQLPTGEWRLEVGDGLKREDRSETLSSAGDRVVTTTTKNGSNTASYQVSETYHEYPFGEKLIERKIDPAGAGLTTSWAYYDNQTTDGVAYGALKQVVNADGSWERYEYDSARRLVKVVSTWLNGSPTASESSSRVLTTSWSTDGLTATIIEKVAGDEVARRYWVKNSAETEYQNIVCTVPGAAIGASTNLITTTQYVASGEFKGQVAFVSHPDGTISTHSYSRNPSNGRLTTVEASGQASGTTVVAGKRTTTVEDTFGNLLSSEVKDIASGLVIESYEVTDADEFGRPLRIDYNDGSYEEKTYTCCGVDYERARDGTVTTYGYDGLKRLERETRGGISTLYTYDGSGRVLTRSRKGTDNSVIVQETNTYDLAGRQKTSKDALNYTTTFDYEVDGGGRTVKTTTYPDSGTRIETTNKDGQLASVLGTAVHPTKMEYGTVSTGLFQKEIKVGEGGAETEWTRTETDAAGRTTKTVGANGGETVNSYNSLGQLAKVTDPDGVRTLYTYNGEGDREKTILDKDQSNSQSADDLVTLEESSVLTAHGTTVQRRETRILNVSNAWVVANRSDSTPNGLSQWTEQWGLPTSVTTTIGGGGSKTETTLRPDGSQLVRTSNYDRVITEIASAGSDVMSSTTYHHDAHGRVDSSTDARNGVTTYHYTDRDQVDSTTNPGSQTTGYAYDSMGRMEVQTLPDSSQVSNEYYPTGELKKTSGSQTYTAQYTYHPQGRVKTLTTTGAAGTEVTTWNYNPVSGLLWSKIYANGQGTTYTYKPSGRMETRVWARGITTTYSYNGAGDLTGIDYSDSTPDVTYGRNRLRQITNITDGAGTRTLSSSDDGRPTGETYDSGMFAGITSSTGYDSLKRRDSHTVNVGSSALVTGYGYDGGSRLETVTSGSDTAVYHYAPNSNLIDTVTQKSGGVTKLVTSKAYDSLNRLTSISAVAGANVVSSHTYIYNSLNQRSLATLHDGTKWDYSYDPLGQVTGGSRSWSDNTPVAGQQFGYNYDGIGNRTSTTVNGRTASYTSNTLNQYSSRTVPGAIDIMGEAASDATVTINSLLAQRKGAYFYKAVPFSNQTTAQYPEVKVMAVKNGAGSGGEDLVAEQTGRHYLAKTPEAFTYDADGNILTDGRWQYTWDGENRLIAVCADGNVPEGGKRRVTFSYDAEGRRIQKRDYPWNGGEYVIGEVKRFVYDVWNLVAELNLEDDILQSYSWGIAIDSKFNQLGDNGGLISIATDAGTYCPVYDGGGNVVFLMKAENQAVVASYRYGPFGEDLGCTEEGISNPFRYATKYTDMGIGLSNFGLRYYSNQNGRWINRDPILELGGICLYGFAKNNPLSDRDILGLYSGPGGTMAQLLTLIAFYASGDSLAFDLLLHYTLGTSGPFVLDLDVVKAISWVPELSLESYPEAMRKAQMVLDGCGCQKVEEEVQVFLATGLGNNALGYASVHIKGEICMDVGTNSIWKFKGYFKVIDRYDFNAANRGFAGEYKAAIARLGFIGQDFQVYAPWTPMTNNRNGKFNY